MNDSQNIRRQLASVRRAWLRTAVFAGCAIAAVEGIGILVMFLLVDLLFVSTASAHTVLATLAWTAVAALFAWHGSRPCVRRISDRDVALFIEERHRGFKGALLTAIEFADTHLPPAQAELVSLAVTQAIAEAGACNPVASVRLGHLRKYVNLCACLLLIWSVALLVTPENLKRRVLAAFNPLHDPSAQLGPDGRPLDPALAALLAGLKKAEEAPRELKLELDPGAEKFRVRRGDALRLEAICSRRPDPTPRILVRSQADANAAWRAIDMAPVERANGFGGQISDISEALVFCVVSGDVRTSERQIAVYDPLVLASIDAVITPPSYLGGAPVTLPAPDGDLKIPDGGKAELRFTANRALAKGTLRWEDGTTLEGSSDKNGILVLAFAAPAAPVTATTFSWTVRDADGEELASSRPARLLVEGDHPPTVELEVPTEPVAVLPRSEIQVRVKAWDDHGLVSNELRWTRRNAVGAVIDKGVVPLTPLPPAPRDPTRPKVADPAGTVILGAALALETIVPPWNPQDIIIWNVTVTDGKKQEATTTLGVISILDYEPWQAWDFHSHPPDPLAKPPAILLDVFNDTWDILRDRKAHRLAESAVLARSQAVAKEMEATEGEASNDGLKDYLPPHETPSPALEALGRTLPPLVKTAHASLQAGDPQAAMETLEAGLAQLQVFLMTQGVMKFGPDQKIAGTISDRAKVSLERARIDALKAATKEAAKREAEAKLAAAAGQALRQLRAIKREHDLVQEQVVALDARTSDEVHLQAPAVAERERKLAERIRAVADDMNANPVFQDTPLAKLPLGINQSETAMRAAVAALGQGDVKDALHQATIADQTLGEVLLALKQYSLDSLSGTLEAVGLQLAEVLARQRELMDRTQALVAISGDPGLAQQRETAATAAAQARLKGETDSALLSAEGLPKAVEAWAAAEVLHQVELALKSLHAGKPGQKMVNSVIELQAAHAAKALAQEQLAEKSLAEALAALRAALASVAVDRAQLMAQINKEVKLAQADLAAITTKKGKSDKTQKQEDAKADGKAADGKGDGKGGDQANAKADDKAAGGKGDGKGDDQANAKADDKAAGGKGDGKGGDQANAKADAKVAGGKGEGKGDDQANAKADDKAADGKGDGKGDDQANAKADAKAAGGKGDDQAAAQAAGGKGEGKGDDKANAKTDGKAAGGKADGQANAKGDGKTAGGKGDGKAHAGSAPPGAPPGHGDGGTSAGAAADATAYRAAERMGNLAALLEKAGLDAKDLKGLTVDPKQLAKRLAAEPAATDEAKRIVDHVARMIEKEVASTADSGKILSGDRGECPPQYRQLVNRYFETLSRFGANGRTVP